MLVEKNDKLTSIKTTEASKVEFTEPKVKLILIDKCDIITTSGVDYLGEWDPTGLSSDNEVISIPN